MTQPLLTKNPIGTKDNAFSRDKKISQPLGTKKIMQPLGTKMYHAISQDKKITPPPWTKKITQPIRTKKSRNLSGQKNHAPSWDVKNHVTFHASCTARKLF